MKPSDRFPPDDPREWLNRARSNLARMKPRVPGAYLEDLCFDAQQASEKALKAVLIEHRIEFPYVHDLAYLISLVENANVHVPDEVRRAAKLSRYAVESRYPTLEEPVTETEYDEAVDIAEAVVKWAENVLDT